MYIDVNVSNSKGHRRAVQLYTANLPVTSHTSLYVLERAYVSVGLPDNFLQQSDDVLNSGDNRLDVGGMLPIRGVNDSKS